MPGEEGLTTLAQRKQLLLAQADLHRAVVQAEMARCQERWHSAREGMRSSTPWVAAGSALAGLLMARKWRTLAGIIPTAFSAWRWYRKLKR